MTPNANQTILDQAVSWCRCLLGLRCQLWVTLVFWDRLILFRQRLYLEVSNGLGATKRTSRQITVRADEAHIELRDAIGPEPRGSHTTGYNRFTGWRQSDIRVRIAIAVLLGTGNVDTLQRVNG